MRRATLNRKRLVDQTDSAAAAVLPPGAQLPQLAIASAIAWKFSPPIARPAEVHRDALVDMLRDATWARLVVLQAPAGFGKTTAMAQVRQDLQKAGVDTLWLTLDPADNDASRLLSSIGAAIRVFDDTRPEGVSPIEAITAIAARRSRLVLFFDDFEAVHEPVSLSIIRSLIDRTSGQAQIIIGSRIIPGLGLPKQRARGQLIEITAETLRFSLQETEHYVRNARCLDLTLDQIKLLHERSEGWVAAIWLASLSLEQRHDVGEYLDRFSGSTEIIAEFLAEEVLASQPEAIRQFMLQTSILRTLEVPVCQMLLPTLNASQVLETLEKRNLFLVSTGKERSYRYHHLLIDFLRERLRRDYPDDFRSLHLAASTWYENNGRPVLAIDHAIEGGEQSRGLSLLERHAPGFLEQGRFRMLARWFNAIPAQQLRRHPALSAISVWATLFTRGAAQALKELRTLNCSKANEADVCGYVNTLHPLLLGIQDAYEDALPIAKAALARLPTGNAFADGVLCNAAAYLCSVTGEEGDARRLLEGARGWRGESAFVRMYSESLNGLLALQAGRLSEAISHFKFAVTASHKSSYSDLNGNAWAGVLYATALYERNHLDTANRLLDVYMPVALEVGLPDHIILSHVIRTRTAYSHGDIDQAFEALIGLEYVGYDRGLPRLIASAKLERARLLMLQENVHAAREELERADDPKVWPRVANKRLLAHETEDVTIARLRCEIRYGDVKEALLLLEEHILQATRHGRQRRALTLRVLLSIALQRSGKPAAAMDVLAGVLRQASREGFVRLLLDEGEPVLRLVRRFHTLQQETTARRSDPILLTYLGRVVNASGVVHPDWDDSGPEDQLIQPLTRKEIQVLEYVAKGCSNSQVAETLGLSESTVRTHLRNIHAKLSARSRAEAVAIARRLDVIR
jgi:LuxR family maltose regulon positive regulatory protein